MESFGEQFCPEQVFPPNFFKPDRGLQPNEDGHGELVRLWLGSDTAPETALVAVTKITTPFVHGESKTFVVAV